MNNLVSIIVPCNNAEHFVDRCFRSILEQSYSLVEVVAVNDGSTDQTEDRILEWNGRFRDAGMKLVYLSQENQGPAGAINTGLKHVTGEFLVLLDVDDELLPGAILSRVAFLQTHPDINVVRTNGYYVRRSGKSLFAYDDIEKNVDDVFTALVEGKTYNWAGSYMVRTSSLFEFYPDREIYQSRYGQNLQILMPITYGHKCGFIDEPQMNYNIQADSLSHTSAIDPDEQVKITARNGAGYYDIRIHLIRRIVKTSEEIEKYTGLARANYYRLILKKASSVNNRIITRQMFVNLKTEKALTLTDIIDYCNVFYPYAVFPLRCLRKLYSFFRY